MEEFKRDPFGKKAKDLALLLQARYALAVGDYNTPLTEEGLNQAFVTGKRLAGAIPRPDVILYSPYLRTRQTLESIEEGARVMGQSLEAIPQVEDDRIREQEHGLALLYNDWRFFHIMHREQAELHNLQGRYWYQFPQGESVSMVRDRVRSMVGTLIREHCGQNVLMVTHHLTILSIRATLERLTPEEFLRLDEEEKPVNCGVTIYHSDPEQGKNGKLLLKQYNQKLY